MISLSALHSWECSIRCGMARPGRIYLLCLDYGFVFYVTRKFVDMDLCLILCDSFVTRRRLCVSCKML